MYKQNKNVIAAIFSFLIIFTVLPISVYSDSKTTGSVTQSYNSSSNVLPGMVVGLKSPDANTVLPLSRKNITKMTGVVIPLNDATLVLTPSNITKQQVLVANSGRYETLVSNQNGAINIGDYITLSSIDGIAMKATADDTEIIGQSASSFNGSRDSIGSMQLKDDTGKSKQISIGHITANLHLSANPQFSQNSGHLPKIFTTVAYGISNKPVSTVRIYFSLIILFSTIIITGIMLYSGVRNGLISIGRNPLAKKAVLIGFINSVVAGLIVFLLGILAIYFILI